MLSAGVLIIGMLGISWLVMGYWWNPFSPCEAPIQLQSGTIKPPWVLPFGTQVIENRGSVYFSPANAQALPASNLKVKLIPQTNCLSLSCTQVYERTGQMIVDPDTFTLRLSFRFAVKPIGSWRLGAVCGCTEECGGEGSLDYETGPLREGVYQVWLGETRLGEIAVPLEQASLSLNSPLPPYPTPGSEYPPPEATPVFAYPEPGMESSTLATPYPEPAATIPTPTPILRLQPIWYSPVITAALPISPAESIVTGEWLSATRLQLATIGYASSGLFWVDLAAAASSVITALPEPSTSRAYSAASQYGVECGSSLQMVDVVNQTVIRQAELTLNMHASTNCSSYVSWAGDQVAAFAAASDGQWHTYLWRPDGSAPFKVGAAVTQAKAPVWSPDLQQLAFLSLPEDATAGLQLAIVDANGRLIETIPVVGSAAGVEVRWLSPQVVAINSGEAASEPVWRFYTIPGGELLLTWGAPGPGIVDDLYHQLPALSPDQRWFLWEAGGFDNGAMHLSYRLYDAQNRQEILLYDRPSHGLRLSGWSPDGETLYLLHLQTGPDATADPDVPYGLLSYHLDSGRYELLVEDAQAVTWDAAYQKGLVYVFVREGDSQGTLVAGIWDPARRQVLGAYSVKGEPTRYNSFLVQSMYRSYTPAAWSPDGQRVVFFTWDGDLILMNLDGQTQRLASQIGLGRSDFTRLLAWSPDGSRLFVSDRGKAWIGSGWEAKP